METINTVTIGIDQYDEYREMKRQLKENFGKGVCIKMRYGGNMMPIYSLLSESEVISQLTDKIEFLENQLQSLLNKNYELHKKYEGWGSALEPKVNTKKWWQIF